MKHIEVLLSNGEMVEINYLKVIKDITVTISKVILG